MSEYAAKVSTVIDGDLDAVWQALTDPEAIKKYFMGATVATDWKEGSAITWSGDWKGKPFQDKGEILEVKPKQRLRYSHWSPLGGTDDAPENYHVVAVTLDDADRQRHEGGTHPIEPDRRRHPGRPRQSSRLREELVNGTQRPQRRG